jgi:copper chaperone CopZ
MAVFGTGSVASIAAAETKETRTVTYRAKGFSCVTCAVGLDTMLQKQDGVLWSKSSYPDGVVRIKFDPRVANEKSIQEFIGEMGFAVTDERTS